MAGETRGMNRNLPNLLTLSRIAVIPVIVALFYVEGETARWFMLALFAAAAVTDFLDGWLARTRQLQSDFGRFLDPVADKLLIAALLLMLVAFERISGIAIVAAVIILCREILVSGLREFLAGMRVNLPVTRLAKWKTAIQMLAMGFLIAGPAAEPAVPAVAIGEIGICAAALLALVTGYGYMREGLRHMRHGPDRDDEEPEGEPATRFG